jgi:hypothetical protein
MPSLCPSSYPLSHNSVLRDVKSWASLESYIGTTLRCSLAPQAFYPSPSLGWTDKGLSVVAAMERIDGMLQHSGTNCDYVLESWLEGNNAAKAVDQRCIVAAARLRTCGMSSLTAVVNCSALLSSDNSKPCLELRQSAEEVADLRTDILARSSISL